MRDPLELIRFESDAHASELGARTMVVALGGLVDAGNTQRLLVQHLLANSNPVVVASFDIDQLLDYRGRRPLMTFDRDRLTSYEDPSLNLYRLTDDEGTPFLLLAGPEPDYQWERVCEAVLFLTRRLGVQMVISAHGIPMAVPHTRPVGMTRYATDHSSSPRTSRCSAPCRSRAASSSSCTSASANTVSTPLHSPCTCPITSPRWTSATPPSPRSTRSSG